MVSLAEHALNLKSFDEDKFTLQGYVDYVKNSSKGYCRKAYWVSTASPEGYRDLYDVFVESYAAEFGKLDDAGTKAKKTGQAEKTAGNIAKSLWWSFDEDTGLENPLQTRVLPCISYQNHRVMFLLPKNAEKRQTLRQFMLDSNKREPKVTAPLEARFALSLQLAEAVIKVHLAGLTHGAIRSEISFFSCLGR